MRWMPRANMRLRLLSFGVISFELKQELYLFLQTVCSKSTSHNINYLGNALSNIFLTRGVVLLTVRAPYNNSNLTPDCKQTCRYLHIFKNQLDLICILCEMLETFHNNKYKQWRREAADTSNQLLPQKSREGSSIFFFNMHLSRDFRAAVDLAPRFTISIGVLNISGRKAG